MDLYSTVEADDGKAHFVDPSDETNDIDGETTEVERTVMSLCSFEKDGAVRLDSEDIATATLSGLCGHCSRAVDDETMTALADLAGDDATEDDE
jgi:hypothetical protein